MIFALTFLSPEEKSKVLGKFYTNEDLKKFAEKIPLKKEKRFLPKKEFYFYHPYHENHWELSKRLFGENYLKEFNTLFKYQSPFEFTVEYTDFRQKNMENSSEIPSFLFFETPPKSLVQVELIQNKISLSDSKLQGVFYLIHPLDKELYQPVAKIHLHHNYVQTLKKYSELKEPLILINYMENKNISLSREEQPFKKKYPDTQIFQEGDLLVFSGYYHPQQRLCLYNDQNQCQGEAEIISSTNDYTVTKIIKICSQHYNFLKARPSLIPVSKNQVQAYCDHGCVQIPKNQKVVQNPVEPRKKLILENRPMDYGTETLVKTDLEKYETDNHEYKYYPSVPLDNYEQDLGKLYIDPPAVIEDNPYGLHPSVVEEALELINRDS